MDGNVKHAEHDMSSILHPALFSMLSVADTDDDSEIAPGVGERIKEAREAKGLTQAELGRALGISRSAVNQLENGTSKQPAADNLLAIQRVTGYAANYLIKGKLPKRLPMYSVADDDPAGRGEIHAQGR